MTIAIVLVIGDTHCPGMRKGYPEFLDRTAEKYGATRVVHIGDVVDWHTISYHEKNPELFGATEEFRSAKKQVKLLTKRFPVADWLLGNHDVLPNRQAATAGLPPQVLRGHADLWDVGWKVHQRFSHVMIDGVIYSHGEQGKGGQFAAIKQAKDNHRPTVIGHLHSQAGVYYYANHEFREFGMSVGCGIDHKLLQFSYGQKMNAKPILGCGVVINGKQAVFVPWELPTR